MSRARSRRTWRGRRGNIPGGLAGLAAGRPGGPRPSPSPGGRMLLVAGEYGPTFETTTRAASRLPGAQHFILDGYEAEGWSDTAAARTHELIEAMTVFLAGHAVGG